MRKGKRELLNCQNSFQLIAYNSMSQNIFLLEKCLRHTHLFILYLVDEFHPFQNSDFIHRNQVVMTFR